MSSEIRQRATASKNTLSSDTDDEKPKIRKQLPRSIRGVQQNINHDTLNIVLAIIVVILLFVSYAPELSKVTGNLRFTSEPLPTVGNINEIIYKWGNSTDKVDTQLQPLPGPIPRHLFIPSCGSSFSNRECSDNTKKIEDMYRESFGGSFSSPVTYLDESNCLPIIKNVEPRLADPYEYENLEINKSNMCRISALYLYGGYYIDWDVDVRQSLVPSDGVTFVTAIEESGNGFFQAFLGATPHHPIMEQTLKNMVLHYEKALIRPAKMDDGARDKEKLNEEEMEFAGDDISGPIADDFYQAKPYIDFTYMEELTKKDPGWNFGTRTLKDAFASLPESAQGETLLLQELHLNEEHKKWYPEIERRESEKCCCNFVVHDPRTHIVHFWSRIVGSTFC